MSAFPLVSIIVPVYDREDYLEETVESLLSQTYEQLEIVIVDDGSTDGTPTVIERLLERAPERIVAARQDNQGQPGATNRGFELASGELLGYLSSDDLFVPGAIGTLVAALVARPDAVAVYPDYMKVDGAGEAIDRIHAGPYELTESLRNHDPIIGPGALVRRTAVDAAGGMDPEFWTTVDFEFWLRIALQGPILWVPEPLAHYRVHGEMLSLTARGVEMAKLPVRLLDHFYALGDLPEEVEAVREQAYMSAYVCAAMFCRDGGFDGQTRFFIADRRAPQISDDHGKEDFEAELAARGVVIEQQQQALEAYRQTVANRDERIEKLRDAVETLRAAVTRLQQERQRVAGGRMPGGARRRLGSLRRRLRGAAR